MEVLAMLAALLLMLAAIVFKIFSAGLISKMKQVIGGVELEKQGILNQLKAAQAQRQVAAKNQKTQERKLKKLKGKQSRLNGEMEKLNPEKKSRQYEGEEPME